MESKPRPNETGRESVDPSRVVIFGALFEGMLAPLAVGLGWLLGQPALTGFSWSLRDAGLGVVATLPLLAFLLVSLRFPIRPMARIKQFFDAELRPLLGGRPWSDLALISIAAGVGEEMLFRGALQGALGRWFGPYAGLALASLMFGLLHPITPGYIIIAGVMGAYLGGVWLWNGNLLTVMVAHALYDFLALLILLRPRASEDQVGQPSEHSASEA